MIPDAYLEIIRLIAGLLTIFFSGHKLYRWIRRKFRGKRKPTAK